jgi:hypothetical protein
MKSSVLGEEQEEERERDPGENQSGKNSKEEAR